MKMLWISTSPIGPAGRILSLPYQGTSGGWIQTEYEALSLEDQFIYFLCASPDVPLGQIKHAISIEGEAYCINLPKISYGKKPPKILKKNMEDVIKTINPDIIQIWGTESCISYLASECFPHIKKVIFIQGLIGMHARYIGGYINSFHDKKYYKGVSFIEIIKEIIKAFYFKNQIFYEQKTLTNCLNVISDNEYTKAYCMSISQDIVIYTHNLFANQLFKGMTWNYDHCEKESIFTVYGITAEKGLHQLLKALKIIKKVKENVVLYIPGPYNIDEKNHLKLSKSMRPFERWLYNYILENELLDNVIFVGKLDIFQMIEYLKKCNIFVNPSCMEVHALSLREALTVGVPSVSTFCGSVSEYINNGINAIMYRYEEHEILAYYILKILQCPELACNLSSNAIQTMKNYEKSNNSALLHNIYTNIINHKELDDID
ncbi:MAG: glycosyltransferase [Vallitaleaceae bacterium]|nr:glycosyltransferase [Vallitaleaceae bacterium]